MTGPSGIGGAPKRPASSSSIEGERTVQPSASSVSPTTGRRSARLQAHPELNRRYDTAIDQLRPSPKRPRTTEATERLAILPSSSRLKPPVTPSESGLAKPVEAAERATSQSVLTPRRVGGPGDGFQDHLSQGTAPSTRGRPGRASTVSRLAAEFSASELVAAAIPGHSPQDFSGKPLPSGTSVDSHALSSTRGPAPAARARLARPPRGAVAGKPGASAALVSLSRAPLAQGLDEERKVIVEEVWSELDSGRGLPLSSRQRPDGSVKREFGVSPPEYLAGLMRESGLPLQPGESAHHHQVLRHARQGRVLSLEVDPSFEQPFTVVYEAREPKHGESEGALAGREIQQAAHANAPDFFEVFPERPLTKQATLLLAHGTLAVTGSKTNSYGSLLHEGKYTPTQAGPIEGSNYADFLPSQAYLIKGKVDGIVAAFGDAEEAGALRVPPIVANLTPDGDLMLIDGHHRLAAALLAKAEVNVEIFPSVEEFVEPVGPNWARVSYEEE
jgi:hypothetical protein